jgi:hypothetical protein
MSGDQPLADTIEHLHVYLHVTLDVLLDFENAVRLRDAIVGARAEGSGEAQLNAERRSVAIKAAFHPDGDSRGHEQISIGER